MTFKSYPYHNSSPAYHYQYGAGLPAFRGGRLQKGHGLGGLFRGLMRTVAPTLKRSLVNAGKRALKTSIETLSDVSQGQNIKTALKRRAEQNLREVLDNGIKRLKTGNQISSRKTSRQNTPRKQRSKKKKRVSKSFGVL